MEKINIRGAINSLELEDPPLQFPKSQYLPSVIRSTAGQITVDTGKRFTVSTSKKETTVKRIA